MKLQQLFDKPEKWTKGAFAKNAKGEGVIPDHPTATSWCLSGGLSHCYGDGPLSTDIYHRIVKELNVPFISNWNDEPETTFDDIRNVITKLDL